MKKGIVFASLILFLLVGSEAGAITGLGFGVRGGVIQGYQNDKLNDIPTGKDDWLENMPMVGVHLKIGTLRIIHLEASVEYAWKKQDIDLIGLGKTEFSINDLSLNGTAKYMFSLIAIKPYVGAGVGVHRLAYGISLDDQSVPIPEDENKLGYHVVGGVLLSPPATPLELMAEARYTRIQTGGASTKYATFLAGITFNLP
jgi:opacity protein-like surface antigen